MNLSAPRVGVWQEYDVHDHLGSGAFARVHRAMHMKSKQWYALKIINATDDKMRANFAREISTMELLSHRNICKLRETFIENDKICAWVPVPAGLAADGVADLVLELVRGGDLLDRILATGGLNEEQTRDIVKQMCDALAVSRTASAAFAL
jgi:serine/threonine/tyrosine protein kinase RAD53